VHFVYSVYSVRSLLLATSNRDKVSEIKEILAGVPYELVTLADYPGLELPEESGDTFADNARAKALYYARAVGGLVVAEDSGLEIDALGGAPGVESARYGGVDATYPEKFALIFDALARRQVVSSRARFVCAVALVEGSRVLLETQGAIEGTIAREPRGSAGFGYDPIFFYPPFGCTLAEAADRKAAVSHRGKAFRALRAFLEERV
jgi:XTP/dITP diphosphohydrolase